MFNISTVPISSLPTFENVMISLGVIFNIVPLEEEGQKITNAVILLC